MKKTALNKAKAAFVAATVLAAAPAAAQTSDLVARTAFRVCADPANMPFSNDKGEGFENKIAELLASKLKLPVEYTWFPQATGFVRKTLTEKRCDVIMGYAQGDEFVLNTNAYYLSTYAFVTKADGPLADVASLKDERLKGKRLGVIAGTPPGTLMAREGLIGNAKPYHLMVDRRFESPGEQMVKDVASGKIDGGLLWGPIAGWYAKQEKTPLKVTPFKFEEGGSRMVFRITLGVRQSDIVWKRELNALLRKAQPDIDAILRDYGVPLVTEEEAAAQEPAPAAPK